MTTILLTEGFENHTDWTHNCRVFRAAGNAEDVQVGNIFVPGGWRVWWDEANGYVQPEGRHCHFSVDKRRIRTGAVAYQLFTFGRLHHAGLSREFEVGAWKRVRVTAYCHAWSNHRDGPHKDDGKWSEWAGYEEVSIDWDDVQVQTQAQTTGDQQLDAAGNMRFRVGLGGADLVSVNWGDGVCVYNDYQEPVTIEGLVGESGKITVWLESTVLWEFTHCDAFWDDVLVEVLDGQPEPPDPDPEPEPEPPEPEPGECRGKPREQYERVVNVYPAGVTKARMLEICSDAWEQGRQTVTGSYDDGGVGDLDSRKVVLWDIPAGERWLYTGFYEQFYPGVVVEFVGDGDENPPEPSGILLAQRDARWANTRFGSSSCSLTIGQSGCFITSLAMAQRVYGIKADATPVTVDAALGPSGYTGCLATWAGINAKLGMTISGATMAQVLTHLDAGGCAMAEVSPETLQHFVLVTRHEGLRCWMYDPWKNVEGWLDDYYIGVDSWRKLGKNGAAPQPEPPSTFNPRVLTLHLQSDVEAAQRFVTTCRPAGVKRVDGAQSLPTYAVLNPGMRCVYRGMDTTDDPIAYVNMHIDTLHQVADMFEERGLPLIDGHYFWWELQNELWGYDRQPNIERAAIEIACTEELARREPRVGVVAFNAGVGNIHPPNFDVLVPLGQAVQAHGGMFGLHSYFGAIPTRCTLDNYDVEGRWLEYRFEMTDTYLVAHGVKVNWFLSEGGAIYYEPPTNMPSSGAGWRYGGCMGGNLPRYLACLEQLDAHLHQWNVAHGGRVKGYALFTQGGGSKWANFELGSAELDAIAAMQRRLWPV